MKQLMFVMGILLATACGGGKGDDALKKFEGFKDKMCACKDTDCVEKVQTEWRDWRKSSGLKKEDLSEEQNKRGKKIDDEMDACRDKIRAEAKKPADGAAPPTEGAPPAPTEPAK
jgi:hypothetical protein